MLPTIFLLFVVFLMGVFILLSFLQKNGKQPNQHILSDEEIEKIKKKSTT